MAIFTCFDCCGSGHANWPLVVRGWNCVHSNWKAPNTRIRNCDIIASFQTQCSVSTNVLKWVIFPIFSKLKNKNTVTILGGIVKSSIILQEYICIYMVLTLCYYLRCSKLILCLLADPFY